MGRILHRLAMPFALVAMVAATLVAATSLMGSTADAQAVVTPTLSINDQDLPAEGPLSIEVTLEPGSTMLAALTASVEFDPTEVAVVACNAGLTGVCNDRGDEVAFALFSIEGFTDESTVLTVDFELLRDLDEITLDLDVMTAVDVAGLDVPDLAVFDSVISLIDASGSLTGEVTSVATGETLYGIDVCITSDEVGPICAPTTGLGTFRFDGLPAGTYSIATEDPSAAYASGSIDAVVSDDTVTAGVVLSLPIAAGDTDNTPDDVDENTDSADAPDTAEVVTPDTDSTPTVDEPTNQVDEPTNQVDEPTNQVDEPTSSPTAPAAAGTIRGVIVDANGQAVFGAQVCANQAFLASAGCVYSTADGSFVLADLGIGNYVLSVTDPAQRYADVADARYVGLTSGASVSGLVLTVSAR